MIKIFAIIYCLSFTAPAFSSVKARKLTINTESFASIFVDGKLSATTSITIKIPAYSTVHIRVEKVGFIAQERIYVNDGNHEIPPKDYIQLDKDDALEASVLTDLVNRDVDIRAGKSEDEAWKLANRIVTSYFDVIAITDKATGYLCTAWVLKPFKSATVRTRLIVKTASTEPLGYKIKIVSEIAPPGAMASADDVFRPWNRLLRIYENALPELQSRLSK